MIHHPLRHWLSLRVRLACVVTFVIGTLLPPYIPKEALVQSGNELPVANPQFLLVEDGFLMKSSSLTQQGSRRAYAEGLIHTVGDGESVERIALKYHLKSDTVRWTNKLSDAVALKPGQELIILPVDGILHTVSRGQTLHRIAELYGVPSDVIEHQNKIEGGFILAGQELIIPGGRPIIVKPVQIAVKPGTPPPNANGRPQPASPGKATGVIAEVTAGILQMPCNDCFYTQYFHPGHYAVDLQQRGGGPVFAAEAGTVIRADVGWEGGYGNVIEIDHSNGLVTLYAHNKEIYVKKGAHVNRGQEIAFMGNTGRVYGATGIHTHFEVRVNGEKKNPLLYLQ